MAESPDARETLRLLIDAARSEGLGFLAAAIAYYAFVSLIPLVIIALAAATLVGGETFAEAVAATLAGVLTPETLQVLEGALSGGTGRGGATIAGIIVLSWSGLRLFRGLDEAIGRIYGTTGTTTFVRQIRDASVTLAAIGTAVGTLAAVMAIVRLLLPSGSLLAPLGTALLLPVAFFPVYFLLPNVPMTPSEALPGAILAGLGWTLLGWLFAVYTATLATTSVYGAVGVVLLALTWFYAGALLVLLGAVLNAVRSGRTNNRQLQQVADQGSA
ncbi:MAG: YihY/virulence factor BrkB family protein [Salinirussus sp.]